jgi:hypothetical protein
MRENEETYYPVPQSEVDRQFEAIVSSSLADVTAPIEDGIDLALLELDYEARDRRIAQSVRHAELVARYESAPQRIGRVLRRIIGQSIEQPPETHFKI